MLHLHETVKKITAHLAINWDQLKLVIWTWPIHLISDQRWPLSCNIYINVNSKHEKNYILILKQILVYDSKKSKISKKLL